MPLKRTPPASPLPTPPILSRGSDAPAQSAAQLHLAPEPTLQHCVSAPDLTSLNAKRGKKRKPENDDVSVTNYIKELFANFSKDQEFRFKELKDSLESISLKHDEFIKRISALEEEKKEDKQKIQYLEERVENLERKVRASCIELRNIPKASGETKNSLCDLVSSVGKVLNIDIRRQELKDIYRIKSKDHVNPIIAEFSTVLQKENFIRAVKEFNRTKNNDEKFSTWHLNLDCPKSPIFVSESLTPKTQKIFFMARNFKKSFEYMYCWTSHGSVFLRKNENSPQIKINCEADLDKLKGQE